MDKIILEIRDNDFDISSYSTRKASRGILRLKDTVAFLNVCNFYYHKLPGGGIDNNETPKQAFKREILEETGCKCKIKDYAGITLEYRDEFKLVQISYVFFADVVGKPKETHFEQSEIDEGFQLKWVPAKEIENLLYKDRPSNYEGGLISRRDKAIFNYYKKDLITNNKF